MKARIATLTVVVLLLTTGLLPGAAPAVAQPDGQSAVQNSISSGGNYRLIGLEEEASAVAVASGGGYRLFQVPEAQTLAGSGCCCTYLPCILRNN
jgi:hypothetical protein